MSKGNRYRAPIERGGFAVRKLLVTAGAICAWLYASMAYGQWPHATYGSFGWMVDGSVRILDRPGTDTAFPVITDSLTGATLLDSSQASDLSTGVGFDMRALKHVDYATQWELRTFYQDWENNQFVDDPNLTSPFLPGITPTSIAVDYESDIYNFELNMRRAVAPGITLLAGPRFLYLADHMELDADFPFLGIDSELVTRIDTKNPLFGAQVGAELVFPVSRDVYTTGFIKVGGFGNEAQLNTDTKLFVLATETTVSEFRNDRSHGAFVGEVGGRVNFDIVPGTLSLYGGYEATWIDGVALAPAQLATGLTSVQVSNTTFFHGAVFGASMRW